ncbi:MAG: DUF167 domain-containing protein [Rhabdochlamydiaceae bacterium]|jgi:uncharacterized protein|nr:DUF167 domain-containing protein [Rhabdochlamydiaceae bacterium]
MEKCRFLIRVSPRAFRSECLGWEENILKIKLRAIPDKGSANEELIAFLSSRLQVSKSCITLQKGHTSRLKQIEVLGLSLEKVQELLGQ